MRNFDIIFKGRINMEIAYDHTVNDRCWQVTMDDIETAIEQYLENIYNTPFRVEANISGPYDVQYNQNI